MTNPTRSYHRTVEQADGHNVITLAYNDVPEPGTRCDHKHSITKPPKSITGTFNNKLRHEAKPRGMRTESVRCPDEAARIIGGMNLCTEHLPL